MLWPNYPRARISTPLTRERQGVCLFGFYVGLNLKIMGVTTKTLPATVNVSNDSEVDEVSEDGSAVNDSNDSEEENSDEGDNDGDLESNEGDISDDGNALGKKNAGWADSIAKILKSKKPKGKKSLVLSKAKKITGVKKCKEKVDFEVVDEEKQNVQNVLSIKEEDGEPAAKKKKLDEERHPNLRIKPNVLEKEREKILSKIATRGVVQLFNAVRNQQKEIDHKVQAEGRVELKKEKVMKSMDKNKFLDGLMGKSKSENVNKSLVNKFDAKKETKKEGSSTWNVLRDDFMMGAKMKDWDKNEKVKDADEEDDEMPNMSDSDSE